MSAASAQLLLTVGGRDCRKRKEIGKRQGRVREGERSCQEEKEAEEGGGCGEGTWETTKGEESC